MKVKLKEAQELKEKEQYPFVGTAKNSRITVLFIKDGCGTVLDKADGDIDVAQYHDQWDMTCFTPTKGKVILSND